MRMNLFIFMSILLARSAAAATLFAPAGIDNVQSYSSNPFYSADAAYNQRFPTPVYVKGPDLTAAECQLAVESAIWTQCSFRNNCAGLNVSDIRPAVMMELSNRQGANYVTACGGYIDNAFNQYKQQTVGAVYSTGFPSAPLRQGFEGQATDRENPFAYYNQVPQYELEKEMRKIQLENMQRQNTVPARLTAEQMPATFEDMSFTDRMAALEEGWQHPAVGKPQYAQLKVESDNDMYGRQSQEAQNQKAVADTRKELEKLRDIKLWCTKYPDSCQEEYFDLWCEQNKKLCEDYKLREAERRQHELDWGRIVQPVEPGIVDPVQSERDRVRKLCKPLENDRTAYLNCIQSRGASIGPSPVAPTLSQTIEQLRALCEHYKRAGK